MAEFEFGRNIYPNMYPMCFQDDKMNAGIGGEKLKAEERP